jgi:hypothetical protein
MIIANAAAFGYPNDSEAKIYCNAFRLALGSATGFFIMMHFITIACYYMITQNEHRNSFVHDEIDFDAIARDLEVARKSQDMTRLPAANAPPAETEAVNPLSKDRV